MGCIIGECLTVLFHFIRQLKEQLAALVIPLEEGFKHNIPLGKIVGNLSGIAVCSGGGNAVLSVNEACNGLVQGDILRRKIVVIVIIGVELF